MRIEQLFGSGRTMGEKEQNGNKSIAHFPAGRNFNKPDGVMDLAKDPNAAGSLTDPLPKYLV
ncbi:MAG: hypothetical protein ABL921_03470 [Pirellula sp.]